jgi:hypothetical protein
VVTGPLFSQIASWVDELFSQKGDFRLVMLVPSPTQSERWTLVVSADWAEKSDLHTAVSQLSHALRQVLSKANSSKIERISVLRTSDPIVNHIASAAAPLEEGKAYRIFQSSVLDQLDLTDAVFFVSQPSTYRRQPTRRAIENRA